MSYPSMGEFKVAKRMVNQPILGIAPTKSGKSVAVLNIMVKLICNLCINRFYIINGTEDETGFYKSNFPKQCIRSKYSFEDFNRMFQDQKRVKKSYIECKELLKPKLKSCGFVDLGGDDTPVDRKYLKRLLKTFKGQLTKKEKDAALYMYDPYNQLNLCIILDDLSDQATLSGKKNTESPFQNDIFKLLMYKGRHYFITLIVLVHNVEHIDRKLIDQFSYKMIFNRFINEVASKRLYQLFGSNVFDNSLEAFDPTVLASLNTTTKREQYFKQICFKYTENYGVLVFSTKGFKRLDNCLNNVRRFKAKTNKLDVLHNEIVKKTKSIQLEVGKHL